MEQHDYTKEDITDSLRNVGIKSGDNIFVHSNLGFFGVLKGAKNENDYWKIFKEAIFNVIGSDGTLVVPTFSYSFCWNKEFDINNTPCTVGLFSELVRKDIQSKRSEDANFSISAIGLNAKNFTKDSPSHSFGKNSFWERFLNSNGKICCFNVGLVYNTLIHYVEKFVEVPYRYDKTFKGIFINKDFREIRTYTHYVRNLSDPNTFPDLTKLNKIAYELNKAKDVKLGRGQISCIDAKDVYEIIVREIKKDPFFLIKEKPTQHYAH